MEWQRSPRGVAAKTDYRRSLLRTPHSAFRTPHSPLPTAFTLVELLVAVIIIAILVSLLLPALAAARRGAQEARVIVEIKQLETAIAAFKVKYGVEPPSRISLYATAADWTADSYSRGVIKRMWPQFDFGDHAYPWTSQVNLNSGECLLFFLGGILQDGTPRGFSANPAYPFSWANEDLNNNGVLDAGEDTNNDGQLTVNGTRVGPFLEFDAGRIRNTDGVGFPEYLDSLPGQTQPYLYFSSYEGRGYRVSGTSNELPNNGTAFAALHDVYRTGNNTSVSPPAAPQATAQGSQTLPPQKPQTFQIISPGLDYTFGQGGLFNSNLGNAGLQDKADYDNLTNFHGSRLNP